MDRTSTTKMCRSRWCMCNWKEWIRRYIWSPDVQMSHSCLSVLSQIYGGFSCCRSSVLALHVHYYKSIVIFQSLFNNFRHVITKQTIQYFKPVHWRPSYGAYVTYLWTVLSTSVYILYSIMHLESPFIYYFVSRQFVYKYKLHSEKLVVCNVSDTEYDWNPLLQVNDKTNVPVDCVSPKLWSKQLTFWRRLRVGLIPRTADFWWWIFWKS